jgi:hypothetical protein
VAQRVEILSTCDLDRDEVMAAETVSFGWQGVDYEIDLCEDHLSHFHDSLGHYADRARKVAGTSRGRRPAPPVEIKIQKLAPAGPEGTALIRNWARANGYEVSDRGRIGDAIREAYLAAH